MATAEAPAEVRGPGAAAQNRAGQAAGHPPPGVPAPGVEERGRGRVRLPAHGLQEDVPHDRGAEEHLAGKGGAGAVRRDPLLLLHHQRPDARAEVVLSNDRCDQENLIEQLKNGVNALRMPTEDLVSNWAYMVIAAWPGA